MGELRFPGNRPVVVFDPLESLSREGVPGGWNINASARSPEQKAGDSYRPRIINLMPGHFHVIGEGLLDGIDIKARA